jgi:hypothetical protein
LTFAGFGKVETQEDHDLNSVSPNHGGWLRGGRYLC